MYILSIICFVVAVGKIDLSEGTGIPETWMTSPELIKHWGYEVETHSCTTSDGYVLTMHRIPHGRHVEQHTTNITRPVAFLQHPLISSSAEYLVNLPNQSLGYVLADKVIMFTNNLIYT